MSSFTFYNDGDYDYLHVNQINAKALTLTTMNVTDLVVSNSATVQGELSVGNNTSLNTLTVSGTSALNGGLTSTVERDI